MSEISFLCTKCGEAMNPNETHYCQKTQTKTIEGRIVETRGWKPCPFCGGKNIRCVIEGNETIEIWCMTCFNYTIRIPILSPETMANKIWNSRA